MKHSVEQIQMVSLEDLVAKDHIYRKFNNLVNFDALSQKHLSYLETDRNYKGYGIDVLFSNQQSQQMFLPLLV